MESKLQESPMEIRPFIFKVTGDEAYIQDILTDIDRDLTDTFLTQITDDYGADPDLIQVQMLLEEKISILLVSSDMTMEEKEEFASYIAYRILQAYSPIDSELIATLEESPKVEESRIHRILSTGDTYQDDNGNYIIIYDVNDNNVTYTENGKEDTQTDTMDNLNKRIIDNGYEKLNESEIKEEGIFNKKDKKTSVEIFDKEDAKSYLKDIALPITNTIMKNKDAISFELPDRGEIHNNIINYTIKILDGKGADLISIGEQIANNLKDTPIYGGKIEDIKCIPEGNNLILSLIGPKDIIEGDAKIVESTKLDEKINKDNIEANKILSRASVSTEDMTSAEKKELIRKMGYDVDDFGVIYNPDTHQTIDPEKLSFSKDKYGNNLKDVYDIKGYLDTERDGTHVDTVYSPKFDDGFNEIPKSARVGKIGDTLQYNYRDLRDQSLLHKNVKDYKSAESEAERKAILDKVRARRESKNESKIEEDKNMNGTDYAVEAIKSFYENGQLDTEWLENELELTLMNNEGLNKGVYNTRRPAHSPAFDALVVVLNQRSDMALTGKQVQAGFKALGLDFKEILKPTVEYVLEQREDAKEEMTESLEDTDEKIVSNITDNFQEITGVEISEIYNKDLGEDKPIFNREQIDKTSESIKSKLNDMGIEESRQGKIFELLDDKLTELQSQYVSLEENNDETKTPAEEIEDMLNRTREREEVVGIEESKEIKEESTEVLEEARDRVSESLPGFIYNLTQSDFDTYGETAWSGNEPQNHGGVKVYPVFKNGKSDITMEQIEEAVLNEFPELRVWGHSGANDVYFTRKEQKTEDIEEPIDEETEIEEDETILDLLQDRIGQEISVGEFNTLLQSIFGRYNDIFLMVSDIYNVDLADLQEVVVFDDEDMYTITYEIKDQIDAIIAITDVTVE